MSGFLCGPVVCKRWAKNLNITDLVGNQEERETGYKAKQKQWEFVKNVMQGYYLIHESSCLYVHVHGPFFFKNALNT